MHLQCLLPRESEREAEKIYKCARQRRAPFLESTANLRQRDILPHLDVVFVVIPDKDHMVPYRSEDCTVRICAGLLGTADFGIDDKDGHRGRLHDTAFRNTTYHMQTQTPDHKRTKPVTTATCILNLLSV